MTGWKFPITFNKYSRSVETVADARSIKESIYILLMTTREERLMELDYGCDLNTMTFKNLNLNMITFMCNNIRNVIEKWEKRIVITDIKINEFKTQAGIIYIIISYFIKLTKQHDSFTLEYDLKNG